MNFWKMRGKDYNEINYSIKSVRKKKENFFFCNNIFCFDIETSNGFLNKKTGEVEMFNSIEYNKNHHFYDDYEKISLPYLWGFSIDDNVYCGRELKYFPVLLDEIEKIIPEEKYVYIHNLPFEFAHLLNVLNPTDVFAREKRKVITFNYKSWKFKCSLKLINLSLESWAKNKNLPVKKLKENMNYLILRTPKTELKKEIYDYQINDVLIMYYGLLEYRERYGDMYHIPLTQTGEVRQECRKIMRNQNSYRNRCINLIPRNLEEFKDLTTVFSGGYTHANQLYSNQIINSVKSKDISSSYPAVMVLEKYPFSHFEEVPFSEKYISDRYSFIIRLKCDKIESKLWNSFLSSSKVNSMTHCIYDNGRIISANDVDVTMTNIDYEIFKKAYRIKNEEIINFKVSVNSYLNDELVKYILTLYKNKTELKNVEEKSDIYMRNKQLINSMYGMAVTRDITDDIVFENFKWEKVLLNPEKYFEKIKKMKKAPGKIFTTYQSGVWVTAYARRNLWQGILALDEDIVYCDTDSIKYVNEHDNFFNSYNKKIEERLIERCNQLGLAHSYYNPSDIYGKHHMLGIFDTEKPYEKFKTLGAKKYIVMQDGKLKMTLSGVKKDAVKTLHDISEFKDGLIFNSDSSGRLISFYNDNQTPVTWNKGMKDEYYSDFQHGICLMPSSYTLGLTPDYLLLINSNIRPTTEILN